MASTLVPILSGEWGRGGPAHFGAAIILAVRMLWLAALPGVVFFLAACPVLMQWFYGSPFVAGWPVAFLCLIVVLLVSINETVDRALAASGRIWLSTINNLVWAVLFAAGVGWLVPTHLALGYAIAYCASFVLYVALQLGWISRLFQSRLALLLPSLVTTAPLVFAAWMVAHHPASAVQALLAALLAGSCALLLWRFCSAPGERQALRARLRRLTAARAALPDRLSALLGSGSQPG
jgi:O-antigen/teichoic acid export membrane protein